MIVWICILCVNLYVEDCEIIEALKRLVQENPGVFVNVLSSEETCSGKSRCIFICYKCNELGEVKVRITQEINRHNPLMI